MTARKGQKAERKKEKADKKAAKEAKKKKEELDKLYGIDTSVLDGRITIECKTGMITRVAGREVQAPINFRIYEVTGNIPPTVNVIHNLLAGASRDVLNTKVETVKSDDSKEIDVVENDSKKSKGKK